MTPQRPSIQRLPHHGIRLQFLEVGNDDPGFAACALELGADPRALGEFCDQGEAKWIVIRGQLWGLNDTPFGRPTPRPACRLPGGWPPSGRI
jgi:hypothetical protein